MRATARLLCALLLTACPPAPDPGPTGGGGTATAGGAAAAGGSGTAGGAATAGGIGAAGGATAGGSGGTAGGLADGGTLSGLDVRFERATPEQIGIYAPVTRALNASTTLTLRYKEAASSTWRIGHPLLRIHPEWVSAGAPQAVVDAFAGTVFDLVPGTSYDLELTLTEPGQQPVTMLSRAATRPLPRATGAATVTAMPTDNLQMRFAALTPGAVLEVANGTYTVNSLFLNVSGTAAQPITIRGASRTGVVLRDTTGTVLQLQNASNVVIENLTLEGSGTDSGTNASSVGISFWNGAVQDSVTLRNLDIRGVDQGIVDSGTARGVLVYDCDLRGNNVWTMAFIQTNLTWNDDGIRLAGEGNCVFENSLHGFGDAFAVIDGTFSAAVYIYRNRLTMTGDDAFEGDYATRNIGFYDNYLVNSATFLSLDPLWGGPLYAFRNVSINTMRGPFKLNNENTGFIVYNNTLVRTEGTSGWGWVQFDNGPLRNWSFRNNVVIYRGTGNLLAVESTSCTPIDFTNNAWFPDRSVWWTKSGGSFGSIAAARTALPATVPVFGTSAARHTGDVITVSDPFVMAVGLGADHLAEQATMVVPTLRAGTSPKNAGVALPNITDGFTGAAPDMGAIIEGRAVPRWGAMRP